MSGYGYSYSYRARLLSSAAGGGGLPAGRVAEITRMSGDRDPVVPQTYHQRVASEAFSTTLHPVGDPLVPSCVIFTHKAVKDGRWSDPTVWDAGTVPGANATVCSGAFNLIYDVLSDVLIKDIHINGAGSLTFDPAVRTRLWVDTLSVDGKLIIGESIDNPIPNSEVIVGGRMVPQCEIVFWQSEAPLKTARLGLNAMGPVRIHGARKEGHLQIDGSVLAGATSCNLRQNAAQAGWKVGDEVMFVGTEWSGRNASDPQYSGPTQFYMPDFPSEGAFATPQIFTRTLGYKNNQTETRVITAVSGSTISWSTPLSFNHLVMTRTLPRGQVMTLYPVVAMLSQSIRLRSADASDTVWTGDLSNLQKRAHAMFMFDDDIQIRNAEFKNMGRTASDPSLNGPDEKTRYATADTSQPITNVKNFHGRYPLHIHRTGAFFGRKQVAVERCSVWAPTTAHPIPGWGIVQHDSRAAIDNCNVHNARGAGIVSELGNETGQWIGNVVAWVRGDGFDLPSWGYRHENWRNHNGHVGVGYESQARQILQQDNYASGGNHGWTFLQQNNFHLERVPDGDSLRYRDPITQGAGTSGSDWTATDRDTYGVEQAQVPDFFHNHAWDCGQAFFKAHQQFLDRHDSTPFIFKECHWVNCETAYHLNNYTFHYYVYDSMWTGTGTGSAALLGQVLWNNSFINMLIDNFAIGFNDTGYDIAYQGYFHEIDFLNVTTPFAGADVRTYPVEPATLLAWGIMGNATVTGTFTGQSRQWLVTRDEDLPLPYPLAPFGPDSSTRAANPCPAFGQAPYVVLQPGSDITLTPTGSVQFSFKALIVDSLGYRWHGDWQNQESELIQFSLEHQTRDKFDGPENHGVVIARRNGVFNDAGTWKTRAWFIEIDRATGDYFTWNIDFILSGFDAGFLAANTVDPDAIRPTLPLLPEVTRTGAITTPPVHTITSAATASVNENLPLAHELTASSGKVRWAITGGADAAQFEVAHTGGRWLLRWAGDGTKDFEAPADAGANNVYDVQVTATDFLGRAVAGDVAVTVLNVIEAVTEFSDNFTGTPGQTLADRAGYEFISGTPGKLFLNAAGNAVDHTNAAGTTIYRLPDIGRTDNFRMRARFGTAASQRIVCGLDAATGARVLLQRFNNDSATEVRYYTAGNVETIWKYANPASALVELVVTGSTFQVLHNGVVQTPVSGPAQSIPALPTGSRFFIAATVAAARTNVLDDLYIGPA